jgi:hypothetical protein
VSGFDVVLAVGAILSQSRCPWALVFAWSVMLLTSACGRLQMQSKARSAKQLHQYQQHHQAAAGVQQQ